MATLDDVATLASLRSYLGVVATADDARIAGHRLAAVSLIEDYTGRNVLTRTVPLVEADGRPDRDLTFYVADAVAAGSHTLHYRPASAEPGFALTSSVDVPTAQVRVDEDRVTFRPDADGWPERQAGTFYAVDFAVGMAADAVPPPLSEVCNLIVRELYEGSALDAIPNGSIVSALLSPYQRTRTVGPGVYAGVARRT